MFVKKDRKKEKNGRLFRFIKKKKMLKIYMNENLCVCVCYFKIFILDFEYFGFYTLKCACDMCNTIDHSLPPEQQRLNNLS